MSTALRSLRLLDVLLKYACGGFGRAPCIHGTLHLLVTKPREKCRLNTVIDSLLNLFFPEECLLCSTPVAHWKDRSVCADCRDKAGALRILSPQCPSCGLPMPNFEPDSGFLCGDCILMPPAFSGARSFGYYAGELGRLVRAFKFRNRQNLVELLGLFLVDSFRETWDRDDFDLIIAVPLHPERRRERGYNQAGLLARSLSRRVGIPLCERALIRTRSTAPQTGLSDTRRAANVQNAFACVDSGPVAGRRILLVDDVMTTGATVSSASRALMQGGALRVSVLTLARTVVL